MPKLPPSKLPKYCRVPQKNIACYWKDGKRVYLPGAFNSPESKEAYDAEMASLLSQRADELIDKKRPATKTSNNLTVLELVVKFLEWGETHYVKNGKPTGTNKDFVKSSKVLVKLYGDLSVKKFAQKEMIHVQDYLVDQGLSRRTVNDYIRRQKRIFNWGVSRGIIDHTIADRLKYVEALRKGKTKAPDHPRRKTVPDHLVEATMPHLPPVVRDMLQIHCATGMRPSNIFSMTWSQIDTSDDVWIYTPSHKTEHHDIELFVPLNAKCRSILARYMDTPKDAIIFNQRRTIRERVSERKAKRKTKITPSQEKRAKYQQVRREYLANEEYTRYSYRKAVVDACERAGIEKWTPYRLRHNFATQVASEYGKEAAQLLLGHTSSKTTEIYIHENIEKLKELTRKIDQDQN